jgi:drug/metabolite transporter (DMT)-like permease
VAGVAVLLVLGSAFLHATWNARANEGQDRAVELAIAYVTGAVALSPWLIADPPTEVIGLMVLSGIAHGGYIAFLAQAYRRGGLATTYPVARGTAPLLVAGAGVWLLDQTPSAATVVGAAVVALGLAVIGGVAWGIGERGAMGMAIVTGAFIASYTLLDARGVEDTGELGYFAGASMVATILVLAVERASVARLRASWRPGLEIGLFSTAAYALILLAYNRADAANVATLRGTSILFGLLLVRRTVTRRVAMGALAVVGGAVLTAV